MFPKNSVFLKSLIFLRKSSVKFGLAGRFIGKDRRKTRFLRNSDILAEKLGFSEKPGFSAEKLSFSEKPSLSGRETHFFLKNSVFLEKNQVFLR